MLLLMETTTQQEPQQGTAAGAAATAIENPEAAVSGGSWQQSGSIGPFFAVISVLAVLAVLSCVVGRSFAGREAIPLRRISMESCRGCSLVAWVKCRWRHRRCACDVEVGGGVKKVTAAPCEVNADGMEHAPPSG
ncbi:uncharacterized protein LOC131146121 [Malania oleifera]|uniref:uncharacterized protein LOC131146121 n=1 Tax=Malania oleifera TaxID=397392 RepID=UPI0025AE96D3|nr:uncharacterized protein LOC131146121 [Malania oleifera]